MKTLLQGCLESPTPESVARLAQAIGAKPYAAVRIQRRLGAKPEIIYPNPNSAVEAQRTRKSTTALQGWDLPGAGTGSLEYEESLTQIDTVDRASKQALSPVQAFHDRACQIKSAPVVNGRAIFELYETLHADPYGMLISADRRQVVIFRFDPHNYDIELNIMLDAPMNGLARSEAAGNSRIVLSDGDSRFIRQVYPGVPFITMTRAELLAGLDHTAWVSLGNMVIEPVVQRLSANAERTGPSGR